MSSISPYDVYPIDLINAVADKLKKIKGITPPEQSKFWKTASFKEKAPIDQENFWYVRCASLLRKLYVRHEIGVNKLRKEYGGRDQNHVHKRKTILILSSGRIQPFPLQDHASPPS